MKRRNFVKNITASSIAAVTLGIGSKTDKNRSNPKKEVMMKLGCQSGGMSDSNLAFKARHGVYHFDPGSPGFLEGVGWDPDHSLKIVEAASKYGISIDFNHNQRHNQVPQLDFYFLHAAPFYSL